MHEGTEHDLGAFAQNQEGTGINMPEEDRHDVVSCVEKLKECPITLIDQEYRLNIQSVTALAPGKNILMCDAYIEGIENGERVSTGFVVGDTLNIDHHLPIDEMSRQISSTNLAIDYINENGPVSNDTVTIINHTDCDSVLSSAIMRGIIKPNEEFGVAAIAADHTGEANQISDLLQSFNDKRDVEFSLRNLQLLLEGKPIEPEAKELLQKRLEDRERAKLIVANEFKKDESGAIYYANLDKKIDGGLLPVLVPDAKIIVLFSPMLDKETKKVVPGTLETKVRLGMSAPDGTDLRKIMERVDPNWGGRWNAGTNKRKGGTTIDTESYIQALSAELTKQSRE